MDHYLDIKVEPDEEVPIYFIRNKVYSKLHKALHSLNSTEIGVSFPRYKGVLGDIVRLHGLEEKLRELESSDWLGALKGYCTIGSIQAIPEDVFYRTISRKQSNMTEAKLRRLIKRGSILPDEVKAYKAKMFETGLGNAYLELESASNGHKHRRYIQFGELSSKPVEGEFDQFGLSKIATVPWF